MSYTMIDTRKMHNEYEQMTPDDRTAIDKAFRAARTALVDGGLGHVANDDRAEELVAAIAYYVVRSRN
jgi:hypothetical protein